MHMHTSTYTTGRIAYLHAPFMCKIACGPEAAHLTGADCIPITSKRGCTHTTVINRKYVGLRPGQAGGRLRPGLWRMEALVK